MKWNPTFGIRVITAWVILFCCLGQVPSARGQSAAVQQLLLNVTKLAQFRQLLKDLQTSYSILNKGYSAIKDIAAGNFNLHEAFVDGLLLVNPSLAKYRRVADIIREEKSIVRQYKTAFRYFKTSGQFRVEELDYLGKVYSNLVDKTIVNLDALATVLTAGKLRMTDDERLMEINRLYEDTHRMLGFLTGFNDKVAQLVQQRRSQVKDLDNIKQLLQNKLEHKDN